MTTFAVERQIPEIMRVPHFVGNGVIEFIAKPVPIPAPGQLLVQVKANALCGSERFQFYGGSPVTPGHETAGIVAAAGPGTHTPVGTLGVIFLMEYCGECRSCRQGCTNQCLHKSGDMGFTRDGGYGVFELCSERMFFPVDANLTPTEATLLLDIIGTGSHAIHRGQRVHPDVQSVLVAGAGPIGLGVLAMAKILLGSDVQVFISDIVPYRLALAQQLGGVPIQVNEMDLSGVVRAHGLSGVDLAVDTSGKTLARLSCIDALDKRGVLVCVGHGENISLDVSRDLIAPERAVLGSEYFAYHELPDSLEYLRLHREFLGQIITHRFPVESIRQAFEVFFGGETGKVVIEQ